MRGTSNTQKKVLFNIALRLLAHCYVYLSFMYLLVQHYHHHFSFNLSCYACHSHVVCVNHEHSHKKTYHPILKKKTSHVIT